MSHRVLFYPCPGSSCGCDSVTHLIRVNLKLHVTQNIPLLSHSYWRGMPRMAMHQLRHVPRSLHGTGTDHVHHDNEHLTGPMITCLPDETLIDVCPQGSSLCDSFSWLRVCMHVCMMIENYGRNRPVSQACFVTTCTSLHHALVLKSHTSQVRQSNSLPKLTLGNQQSNAQVHLVTRRD